MYANVFMHKMLVGALFLYVCLCALVVCTAGPNCFFAKLLKIVWIIAVVVTLQQLHCALLFPNLCPQLVPLAPRLLQLFRLSCLHLCQDTLLDDFKHTLPRCVIELKTKAFCSPETVKLSGLVFHYFKATHKTETEIFPVTVNRNFFHKNKTFNALLTKLI